MRIFSLRFCSASWMVGLRHCQADTETGALLGICGGHRWHRMVDATVPWHRALCDSESQNRSGQYGWRRRWSEWPVLPELRANCHRKNGHRRISSSIRRFANGATPTFISNGKDRCTTSPHSIISGTAKHRVYARHRWREAFPNGARMSRCGALFSGNFGNANCTTGEHASRAGGHRVHGLPFVPAD